jgi:hypothetical protein
MNDQKADEAKGPDGAVDSGASTPEEKSFENEGGNQAPVSQAPASLMGKLENAARALRGMLSGGGKSS